MTRPRCSPPTLDWQPLAVIRPEFESKPVDVVVPGQSRSAVVLVDARAVRRAYAGRRRGRTGRRRLAERRSGKSWPPIRPSSASASDCPSSNCKSPRPIGWKKCRRNRRAIPTTRPTACCWTWRSQTSDNRPTKSPIGSTVRPDCRSKGPGTPTRSAAPGAAAGLRDIITRFEGGATTQVTTATIAADGFKQTWTNSPLNYIAVDAQYFAAAVIPLKPNPNDVWFADVKPIRVGAVPEEKAFVKLTDVSFRLISKAAETGRRAARRWSIISRSSPVRKSRGCSPNTRCPAPT